MTLADLKNGEAATITCNPNRRLAEVGFVPGKQVTRLGNSLFGDPIRFRVMDCNLAMQITQARQIQCSIGDENDRLATAGSNHR